MIKTLPMNEVSKKVANIYEAAIVIAKRARQINNEQKQMISRESEGDDDYDNYIDDEDGEITAKEFINLPKPSDLSLEEFMKGTLKFDYGDSDEEEEQMDSK